MRGFNEARSDYDAECCGICAYHHYEDTDKGWVCVNAASIYCSEWTEYEDYCSEYERI